MNLRPVPELPPRALGLIRVSKERVGMVSPEVQKHAITEYSRSCGYQITGWLEGLDESGSQRRSAWWPRLEQAVEAVEAGQYDVVVVWKFSRTARNRLKWAVALDRVETAGGRLESSTEQFDTTTSTGRLGRGVLAEINAWEAERTGEVWKDVHARRVRNGLTHNGRARFGYVYDREQQLHLVDEDARVLVEGLFRRFVAGESFYGLVKDLNAGGHRTTTGGLWTDGSLRRAMDSGFHAGFVPYGGDRARRVPPTLHPGAHEAIVGPELWQRYLDARQLRTRMPARRIASRYLLSGLVRCKDCERVMNAGTFGKARTPKYRCETRRATAGAGCRGGMVAASIVHAEVFKWLQAEAAKDVDEAAAVVDVSSRRERSLTVEVDRLNREITRLEGALVRLTQAHAEDPESDEVVFRAARDDYRGRLAELRGRAEEAALQMRQSAGAPAVAAASLLEEWVELPIEARREQLRRLVAYVEVRTGEGRGTPPVVRVVPLWDVSA